ncbi:MAG: 30S ribosomal protein S1 [Anaerolineae bacterium]|nr:30S ribosomal protein S1 [Anaerolineae bacterium]
MKGVSPDVSSGQDLMASLLDEYTNPQQCQRGDIVEGVIVSVNAKTILVDIGGKCDAVVHPREMERMTPRDLRALKPGQPVNVYIIDTSDDNDVMLVSLMRARQQNDWDYARKLLQSSEIVTLPVVDVNKGGVIVRLGQLRGFVPGSQLLPNWRTQQNAADTEHRWDALLGETLRLCVIEVTVDRNRLILSERKATDGKLVKRRMLEQLKVGAIYKGTVSNIVPFGAFVNVNGVDGLLHISELSWRRVNNPKEVVAVGQEVDVYILDVELDRERLGLSLKRITPDPWENLEQRYQEGQLVEVQIVNVTTFGAFAALIEQSEVEGLIHISELSDDPVSNPSDVVEAGERYTARVISLQVPERRIAFSLRKATAPPEPATEPVDQPEPPAEEQEEDA